MVIIYSKQHLTWLWHQCVHIHHQNMHLPHWKCVLQCCEIFPCIYLPSPESDHQNSHVSPTIFFCVHHLIAHCTMHGRHPFNKKLHKLCEGSSYSIVTEKLYTIKELVTMETLIVDFNQQLYIPAI